MVFGRNHCANIAAYCVLPVLISKVRDVTLPFVMRFCQGGSMIQSQAKVQERQSFLQYSWCQQTLHQVRLKDYKTGKLGLCCMSKLIIPKGNWDGYRVFFPHPWEEAEALPAVKTCLRDVISLDSQSWGSGKPKKCWTRGLPQRGIWDERLESAL